jgi:putative transposase
MARKGKSTEEIIGFLREAEVRIAQGETAGKICRGAGISEQTYYKWRREYGGLKIDQAKRLKELERENERLKKAVSELTLDKLILKEALQVVEQEVKAYCRGKIASYKIPSHVFLVDDFPMTGSGKVQKVKLREEARRRLEPACLDPQQS